MSTMRDICTEPECENEMPSHTLFDHTPRLPSDYKYKWPEEQSLPQLGKIDIFPLLLQDIKDREKIGIQRYGRTLQAFNGRDVLRDAYEEALDLSVYLRQLIAERDSR